MLLCFIYVLCVNVECIMKISTAHNKISTYHHENIHLSIYMECHFGQKTRFYYERSRYIKKGRDFIMNGRDILWQIEILLWTVEIFMMTDWDFYDDLPRFSWWQAEILLWTVQIFMMICRDFHDDFRLRILAKGKHVNIWGICQIM